MIPYQCRNLYNSPKKLTILRLPMVLFLLKSVLSYRYLPSRVTLPFIHVGPKFDPETTSKDVPHHVLIVYGSRYCSGSLIYSKIVVTAASCFEKHSEGAHVDIKIGANTMTGYGQIIRVAEYKIHEYFKELSALDNDIALLVLQENVIFDTTVRKTIPVEPEVAIRENSPLLVTGWGGGKNMRPKYLNLLLKVGVVVLKRSECLQYYGNLMTPSNFCVRYTTEHYLSDNGGGAMYDHLLVGILSIGLYKTQIRFNTAILTNVSYFHRWITLNSKRFLKKYCVVRENSYTPLKSDET